jgi:branched-chain amino acid transport system substrate-binding protein
MSKRIFPIPGAHPGFPKASQVSAVAAGEALKPSSPAIRQWRKGERPMTRWCVAILMTLLLGGAAAGPTLGAGAPYEINVVISTTGSGSFLGTHEAAALGVLENVVNASGGIKGRPVKFVFADDQTAPAVAVQLTQGLIAARVPVLMGSSLAATCTAMAALVQKTGPVQYCLSPVIRGAPGSYVYSASAGSDSIAAVIVRFFREHGWKRIAIITSTDASGADFDKQFDMALGQPENAAVSVLDREHFNGADLTVSAQMARIKASGAQAVVTFATGTPLGTLLRGFHDAGLDVPISASAGNMIYAQMAQYAGFAPKQLYFAATRGVAPDANLRPGPIHDAQTVYFNAFKAAGIRPDFASSLVWDPGTIIVTGLRQLGPDATADQLHAWIQGLHSWAGIDGIYDFRDNSQRGIGQNAMVVYHWDGASGTFVVASRPAGHLK